MDAPKEQPKAQPEVKPEDSAKAVSQQAAHSVLSDVYNWGANKVSGAANWAYNHPGEAAAAAAAAVGTAYLATKRLPLLAITTGAAALGLAGCDQKDDTNNDGDKGTAYSRGIDYTNPAVDGRTGTAAGGDLEETTVARVYENPKQCAEDGVFTQNYCNEKFAEAQKEHMEIAPKFESKEECESETGTACAAAPTDTTKPATDGTTPGNGVANDGTTPGNGVIANGGATGDYSSNQATHSSGHSFFMPYMWGYMMGSSNSSSSNYTARPLYGTPGSTASNRTFLTPEGRPIGGSVGRVSVPHSSIGEGHASGGTTSRGGFGSTGRSGSFGARGFGG